MFRPDAETDQVGERFTVSLLQSALVLQTLGQDAHVLLFVGQIGEKEQVLWWMSLVAAMYATLLLDRLYRVLRNFNGDGHCASPALVAGAGPDQSAARCRSRWPSKLLRLLFAGHEVPSLHNVYLILRCVGPLDVIAAVLLSLYSVLATGQLGHLRYTIELFNEQI